MRRVEERDESVKGVIEIGPDLPRCTKLRRTGAKEEEKEKKKKSFSQSVWLEVESSSGSGVLAGGVRGREASGVRSDDGRGLVCLFPPGFVAPPVSQRPLVQCSVTGTVASSRFRLRSRRRPPFKEHRSH